MRANSNQTKLSKDAAVAIANVLLPRCAPTEKRGDYKTVKKCNEWLGSLAGRGTRWEDEMEVIAREADPAASA